MEGQDNLPSMSAEAEQQSILEMEKLIAFAREGFFEAAKGFAEAMKESNTKNAQAILLEAALEFSVKLWDDTMVGIGFTPASSREGYKRSMGRAFKNVMEERKNSSEKADASD